MNWRCNYYICNMELGLYKEEILKIGEYIVSIEGNVGITVDAYDNSLGLKEIILRNILKLYGNQYTLLRVDYSATGGSLDANDFFVIISFLRIFKSLDYPLLNTFLILSVA